MSARMSAAADHITLGGALQGTAKEMHLMLDIAGLATVLLRLRALPAFAASASAYALARKPHSIAEKDG